MHGERRKDGRQTLTYPAQINPEGSSPPIKCFILDISTSGARLKVHEASSIPNTFDLLLATHAQAQRFCRVVWRKEKQTEIGVEFLKKPVAEQAPGWVDRMLAGKSGRTD
jgi:PilZ domain